MPVCTLSYHESHLIVCFYFSSKHDNESSSTTHGLTRTQVHDQVFLFLSYQQKVKVHKMANITRIKVTSQYQAKKLHNDILPRRLLHIQPNISILVI